MVFGETSSLLDFFPYVRVLFLIETWIFSSLCYFIHYAEISFRMIQALEYFSHTVPTLFHLLPSTRPRYKVYYLLPPQHETL